MVENRDFYNCANCKFGNQLFSNDFQEKQCDLNSTKINPNGVCSYYMWDREKFESRKLKIIDLTE